jgi:asparagine synthase (glutamine-hydrolysing)
VEFEHALPEGRDAVASMVRALRAGDAAGARFWTGPGAVLGLRPSPAGALDAAPGPLAGGESPGAPVSAVVSFAGVCDNRAELPRSGPGTGASGAEAVLRSWLALGRGTVDRLRGSYALAVWEPGRAELTLVRDRMGTRPLYYVQLATGVLFASRPDALLAHPLVRARLDEDAARMVLAGINVPGKTVFRDIREVPAGHLVRFSRSGRTEHRYWRPTAAEHHDDIPATTRRVRELLADAVGEESGCPDGRVGSLMSGGLDSSALAALLAGRHDRPVPTFAVDYQGYEENFRPHIVRPEPDSPFVRDMAAHLGTDHTDVVLTTGDLTRAEVWARLVAELDQPRLFADTEPSMSLLYRAVGGRVEVLLSGEGADELFGGFPWFHHPRWAQAPDFPWTPTTDELVGTLFAPAMKELEVLAFRADHYRDALAEIPGLPGEAPLERRMRELTYLFVTRFLPEQLDRAHRFGAAVGVDVRLPFCDHRLVEYALNIPWSTKTFDGWEKSVLRAAVADLLPASVLERRKSGYPMTHDDGYDLKLRTELGELANRPDAPVLPLLDMDLVRGLRRDPAGEPRLSRTELELALKLNAWLEHHELTLPG